MNMDAMLLEGLILGIILMSLQALNVNIGDIHQKTFNSNGLIGI